MEKRIETIYTPLELPVKLFVALQKECYRRRVSKERFILQILGKALEKEIKELTR